MEREDRRSLCSAAWLSVNLWVWPSFLACARKVGVSCVQSSLITSVPRRALCHHYTLTCSIYESSGTFEYSITYMQMLWLCPRLWFIWACNRPPHTYFYLWTNPPGWARSPATLRSPEVIDYSSYSLCYEHIVWQRRSKAWLYHKCAPDKRRSKLMFSLTPDCPQPTWLIFFEYERRILLLILHFQNWLRDQKD